MRDTMDPFTADHFYAWLERNVPEDEQHSVEQNVHAFLREYPEILEPPRMASWSEVRHLADRYARDRGELRP